MKTAEKSLTELDAQLNQLLDQAYEVRDKSRELRSATPSGSADRQWCRLVSKRLDKVCNLIADIEPLEE